MAPSKNNSHSSSSNRNGEVGHQANVLASCYVVDPSACLSGFHYSTTGAGGGHSGIPEVLGNPWESPPSSPPLAALTSANELALISRHPNRKREYEGRRQSRKEGAAFIIREECERLFCGTMKTVFFGEGGYTGSNFSIDMGADMHSSSPEADGYDHNYFGVVKDGQGVDAWMEVWDYAGGCSFRAFVGGKGDQKALFAFFDSSVIGRDLKQGLMALIELADTVFALSKVVICVDRSVPETDRKAFMKSLRWVGFELIKLDTWTNTMDVTSNKWLCLGMEV